MSMSNVKLDVQRAFRQIAHPLTFDPIGIQDDRIHPKKVACAVHNEKRATEYSGLSSPRLSLDFVLRAMYWAGGTESGTS
jgi:hypothetical protein